MEKTKTSKKHFEILKLTFHGKEFYFPSNVNDINVIRKTGCVLKCKVNFEEFANRFGLTEQEIRKHLPYLTTSNNKGAYPLDYTFEVTSYSSCMAGDAFCKKTGKMLAETRAKQKAYRIARELTGKLYTMAYKRAAGLYSFVRDMDKYEAEEKCHELFILERISENENECTFEVK